MPKGRFPPCATDAEAEEKLLLKLLLYPRCGIIGGWPCDCIIVAGVPVEANALSNYIIIIIIITSNYSMN